MLERASLILLALCLAACGTFTLGTVHPQAGKSPEQQQLDTLTCKDQANMAVNSAGHQTGDFFLGMTIVGAPVAYELDKKKQREVFTECMQSRGYIVTPADADETMQTRSVPSAATITPESLPAIVTNQLLLSPPEGFALRPIPESLKSTGAIIFANNRTLDISAAVFAVNHEGITNLRDYASTRRAAQIDYVSDAVVTDIVDLEIGGRHAVRYTVTGVVMTVKLTYVMTVIEGRQELVTVSTWSGATNAQVHMATMESVAASLSGIL